MRLQALEGWRGVTALMVVLFHLYVLHALFYQDWLRYLAPILEFFFMISGFVMTLGFADKVRDAPTFWSYLIRRAGRVWPLHLAMLSLLLLIPLFRFVMHTPGELFSGKLSLEALPYQIFLLQTWKPDLALTWNHPAWTLSSEIVAYLAMGLILLAARRTSTRIGIACVILLFAGVQFYGAMERSPSYNTVAISRGVFGYFLGFILYHVWKARPVRTAATASVLEALATLAFLAILTFHPQGLAYFLVYPAYALLIYAFAGDQGLLSKVVSAPPLVWLGKKAFSIYMFHGVVTTWLMLIVHFIEARGTEPLTRTVRVAGGLPVHVVDLPGPWGNNALALLYLVIVLVGAHFIYQFIEDPSRAYFAKVSKLALKDERAPRAPAAAASDPNATRTGEASPSGEARA